MGEKIRGHIRYNVVGYVALFFALSGGVAWATHPGGANTISSIDIINGEVRSADIASGNVQNSDMGPDAVTGGKIAPGQVFSSDVNNETLTGTDIADDAVSPAELDEMPAARLSGKPTSGAGTTASTEDDTCGVADRRLFNDTEDSLSWWSVSVDFDTQGLTVDECAGTGFATEYEYLRAPIAGTYLVTGHLDWDANVAGTRQLRLQQEGQEFAATEMSAVSESGKLTRQEVSGITRLGAGDRVRMHALVTGIGSGNSVNIQDADLAMTWLNP